MNPKFVQNIRNYKIGHPRCVSRPMVMLGNSRDNEVLCV